MNATKESQLLHICQLFRFYASVILVIVGKNIFQTKMMQVEEYIDE